MSRKSRSIIESIIEFMNIAEKEKAEKAALGKLLKKLKNKKLADEIQALWEEFEEKQTIESKFAQACDKADALIQHNKGGVDYFEQGDYDINPYYKNYLFDFDEFIREFKDEIDKDTMELIEKDGDMSRVSQEHRKKWKNARWKNDT